MIACTNPGKFGDFLYSCPSAKYLTQIFNDRTDWYTSSYCASLRRLMEHQSWVRKFIVPEEFTKWWGGWGIQPWDMSKYVNEASYDQIFQFGFRNFPNRPLPTWFLASVGINYEPRILDTFEYPELGLASYEEISADKSMAVTTWLDEPYVIVAPRGDLTPSIDKSKTMKDIFYDFAGKCPIRVVQIGRAGEAWPWPDSLDITGLDWLETTSWISRAKGFYGIISSQGALAHNFDIPKVFPHNGGGWDMRHVVQSPTTAYPYMPSAEAVLEFMNLR